MTKFLSVLCFGVLLFGCGDDVPTDAGQESSEAASAYFSRPIEVSGKFKKGATVVVSVSGEVSILEAAAADSNQSAKPASGVERSANANDLLSPGDQVRTGAGSEALLLFSNGSTVVVGPGTQVRIDGFVQEAFEGTDQKVGSLAAEVSSSRIKLDLDVGELVVGVKKLDKESSLIISTSMGMAGVRGTQFKVAADQDRTSISVLSGAVDFQNLKNQTRSIAKETKVEATKDALSAAVAIPPADKAQIEAAQKVAKQKTEAVPLGKLLEAFNVAALTKMNTLRGDNFSIMIYVDGSGSLLGTQKTLRQMRDTVMKKALLPFYHNDPKLYDRRVLMSDGYGERSLQFFTEATKKENVLALVFQDEAQPVYHLPAFNKKPEEKYLQDLAALKTGLQGHGGVYRGLMFQVDRGNTWVKSFKEYVENAWRGTGYLSTHNLKDYYWQENKDHVLNRTGVVFSDVYHVKSKGDPQYYFNLIIEAAKKTGLDLQQLQQKSTFDINAPVGKAGIRG